MSKRVVEVAEALRKLIGNEFDIQIGYTKQSFLVVEKSESPITFQDLYDYIQDAEVDHYGVIRFPLKITSEVLDAPFNTTKYAGQIYAHKHQINICRYLTNHQFESMGNIYFDHDEVRLFYVDPKQHADYDNPCILPIFHPIDEAAIIPTFGKDGILIYKILIAILKEWKKSDHS